MTMAKLPSKTSLLVVLLVGLLGYFLLSPFLGYSFTQGPNNRNVSVDTTVNITNSLPEVIFVKIDGSPNNTLVAGSFVRIVCNGTVRDWNGASTITNVSAAFYYNATDNATSLDDNNTHYTNDTCTLGPLSDPYIRNVSCSFPVMYYANAGTWRCNISAHDPYTNFNASVLNFSISNFNITNIDGLMALNVTPLIDYGNLSVGDTSLPQQANVTNLGNQNINISVRGFTNLSYLSNGAGMICDIGNISIESQKFNLIGGGDPTLYVNLSHTSKQVGGLTVARQQNDSEQVINTTFWLLFVPPNPFGRCNGTIVFQAEKS